MRGNQAHTKVHYAGKDDDFILFALSPQAVLDWRGDKSIPLAQVVAGWQVFVTHKHGAQGKLDTASQQSLDNEFGTHQEDEVVMAILEKGHVKETENSERIGNRNWTDGWQVNHG